MKDFNFFGLLALVLLGTLVAMHACSAGSSGGEAATVTFTDTDTQIVTDNNAEIAAEWTPNAVLSTTTGDLKVSGPYAHKNLEIFLIHGEDQVKPEREILTLEEALESKQAVVHETSNVGELMVENLSAEADIYVQSGDIVQGGKQDRVLAVDLVLSPKSGKVKIASFCVEQGRWGARGAIRGVGFTNAAFATSQFRASSNGFSSLELKRAVKVAQAQGEVWENVAKQQAQLSFNLGADVRSSVSRSSLELTLEGKAVKTATKDYTDALAKVIDGKDNVLGFAVAVNGKIASADIYCSHALFQKLWNKLLSASAVEAVAEYKQGQKHDPIGSDKVTAFLADTNEKDAKSKDLTGRVQLLRCESRSNYFFETRDLANGTAWLHRNYLRK